MDLLQSDDETVVRRKLESLVSRGKWHRAYSVGKSYLRNREPEETSVSIALATILAARMTDSPPGRIGSMLSRYKGYTPLIEGDSLRHSALQAIRQKDLVTAQALIEKASLLHQEDEDRMAALMIARARLLLAKGTKSDAMAAQSLHNQADNAWVGMEARGAPLTPQWVMSNRFHYIRAMTAVGYAAPTELRKLLTTEPRLSRRLRARMMHMLGKFGYRVDQLLFER